MYTVIVSQCPRDKDPHGLFQTSTHFSCIGEKERDAILANFCNWKTEVINLSNNESKQSN